MYSFFVNGIVKNLTDQSFNGFNLMKKSRHREKDALTVNDRFPRVTRKNDENITGIRDFFFGGKG